MQKNPIGKARSWGFYSAKYLILIGWKLVKEENSIMGKGALAGETFGVLLATFFQVYPEGHRVGGGITSAVLPHHRAYGSVHGGSR